MQEKRQRENDSPPQEKKESKQPKLEMTFSAQIAELKTILETKMGNLETKLGNVEIMMTNLDEKLSKNISDFTEKITSEINSVKVEQSVMAMRVNDLEQMLNNSTVVITGLPMPVDSVPLNTINTIASKFKAAYTANDFKRLVNIKYKDQKGSFIIANFYLESKKNEFVNNFRAITKENPMRIQRVFTLPPDSADREKVIRVKTLLTKNNMQLLKEAFTYLKKPFKFVWESEGKIMVRKDAGSKAIVIKTSEQLARIAAMET